MTIQAWPASLPQKLNLDDFDETLADNVIRSQTDMGPAMLRRRTTSNVKPVKGSMLVTKAQRQTMKQFYEEDLLSVLRFSWVDMVTDEAVEYRFTKPPKFTPIRDDFYTAVIELELLP